MDLIRQAQKKDVSRIAEILIFAKRTSYRPIFQNDRVSFGEMQVLPLAEGYLAEPEKLKFIWVYDDEFVKGMVHIERGRIEELYVEPFFQGQGIGGRLIEFAVAEQGAASLWVLEKNKRAIAFYERHGFSLSGGREPEKGTQEYIVEMSRLGGSRIMV